MRFYRVPKSMRTQIRAYYSVTWHRCIYFDQQTILNDLNFDLRQELSLFLKKGIVQKVPFLKGAPDRIVSNIVCMLTSRVCKIGEIVVRQGDMGDCM